MQLTKTTNCFSAKVDYIKLAYEEEF